VPKLNTKTMEEANHNDITYFAETNFRNECRKFGIKRDDRRRHLYVVGKTGMGKTLLLQNMIIQDIIRGEGVAVVDPHGELIEEIIGSIPANRVNDVIYFNPSDLEHPIAFNILETVDDEYKHLVSSGLMGVFTKIWANMWSARMEYILSNCILALLDSPGNTLLGINRLLVDKDYRKKIVDKIKDPVVKAFWVEEYANYNERFRTEAIAPIQNKVGQFLSSSVIRNIVGQAKSTIDIRKMMDEKKILMMNLSKGRIGEDNSALLGAMMITRIQLAAMSRVDIPESERKDFYLYVDEFQNFATESFADILSEARKYRLNLIMAHQYIAQLTSAGATGGKITKVKDAVFGNVGTILAFRVGAPDAEDMIKEFEPYFLEEDLVNLTKYKIYLRLMIDGVASKPFSANTLPPIAQPQSGVAEKVIKVSRERYTKDREEVEEKIMRWSGLEETMGASGSEAMLDGEEAIFKAGHVSKEIGGYGDKPKEEPPNAECDNCDNKINIKFTPDSDRNVFCKDCLTKFKAGEIDTSKLPKKNVKKSETDDVIKPGDVKPQGEVPVENKPVEEVAQKPAEELKLEDAVKAKPIPMNQKTSKPVQPGQVVNISKE
jgi:CxxC-x17-CxxC domain-containing protein